MRSYFRKMASNVRYRNGFDAKSTGKRNALRTYYIRIRMPWHQTTLMDRGKMIYTLFTDYYFYHRFGGCWCCRNVSLFLWFYFVHVRAYAEHDKCVRHRRHRHQDVWTHTRTTRSAINYLKHSQSLFTCVAFFLFFQIFLNRFFKKKKRLNP